jgi:uncharacterized protein (DUF1800 family)
MGTANAANLLTQATFGPTLDDIAATSLQGYEQWFAAQVAATPSLISPSVPNKDTDMYPFWLTNVVKGNDQLRQRMAFALSQILVVSKNGGPLEGLAQATAAYYDLLVNNAFGNYRNLLERVTLSPGMGIYLSMFRNDKPNAATGVQADENYAREIMQLFSIGLVRLNLDGTVMLGMNGQPIPTYSQAEVEALARVFTGWASNAAQANENSWLYGADYLNPMMVYSNHHDLGAKTILGGVVVPANGTAVSDMALALDTIFNHPNVGPFLAKQLIQRLVTSNPSPAYVSRVASVFNNNGQGVRGDLLAVAKAILTDAEAITPVGHGKLREPLLRLTHLWRAFSASDASGKAAEPNIVFYYGYSEFAQAPLQSPSVFNFYRPDYRRAGALTDAGLVAPEFQITNEKSLVLTENRLQIQTYQFRDGSGAVHAGVDFNQANILNNSSVMLNTAQWEQYASTPADLVDKLNLVLMAGRMPAAMRTSLITYANAIPSSELGSRVIEVADLIINSPQYAIQR